MATYIGLTGLNASGKGTAADILKNKGFTYYSLSDVVREEATRQGRDHSRENLIYCGNELRKTHGPSVLAKKIIEKIKKDNPLKAVIDSIRNLAEVNELRKLDNFKLIAVDAPVEVRHERAKTRGRVGFERTLKEFIGVEQKENTSDPNKQQLFECLKTADITVNNEGSVADLRSKIDLILNNTRA